MSRSWILLGSSLAAAFGGFLFGFDTAVISGTLSFVQGQFSLGPLEEGWYVSSALLGCVAGVACAGSLSDRLGRRRILLLSSLLFLISTVTCAFAPSLSMLVAGRLVAGSAIGVASMLAPLYISEIAPPGKRGMLVSLYQFAITLGILCAYFSNAWVVSLSHSGTATDGVIPLLYAQEPWRGMFANMIVPNILFLLLLLFIPESPRWLITRGAAQEARRILSRIGAAGGEEEVFSQIERTIGQEESSFAQLFQKNMRRALLIGLLLPVFSQLSG
ncbi:MAG TPA: MFS transporter, partial [Bacteroidota bacterium]|nr:MFS transporter [Bacteroidota bacterium]